MGWSSTRSRSHTSAEARDGDAGGGAALTRPASTDFAIDWLLGSDDPSIRYLTLTEVLGKTARSRGVRETRNQIPSGRRVRALLSGQTTEALPTATGRRPRLSLWISLASLVAALGCVAGGSKLHDSEMQAMTFFGSGALLLTAGLAAVWAWMRGSRHGTVRGGGASGIARLGVRNAARHPVRSLLTAGLLASATFLIIAVQSFYREPGKDFLDPHSGSGGFALLGEADVPIYQNLNSPRGQEELNIPDAARAELKDLAIYPFRVQAGDDAVV